MKNKLLTFAATILAGILLFSSSAAASKVKKAEPGDGLVKKIEAFVDHSGGEPYRIVNGQGKTLSILSDKVVKGDYLITYDNKGWIVERVVGRKAIARFDKVVDLEESTAKEKSQTLGSAVSGLWSKLKLQVTGGKKQQTIGIYHTHSDESYQPTSGVASEKTGDIYQIGDTLAAELRKKGFRVIHSYNNHNPHDAAAYTRSRRTVAELSKYQPDCLIDVHRDAIPDAGYYQKQVSGEEIAASRIVVGKQNANRNVTFDFAKRIKAIADKDHPGLVREIFWGHGNYNQDVGPKTILLEFGTHTNPEEFARRGAALMADIIPKAVFGEAAATGRGQIAGTNRGWTSLLWVLGAVVVLGIGYLVMNRGGFELFKNMGSRNRGTAAGFLGRLGKKKNGGRKGQKKR